MLLHFADREKLTPVCSVGNKDLADMMDAIFALRSDDKTVSSFPTCFLTTRLCTLRVFIQMGNTANHVLHIGRP